MAEKIVFSSMFEVVVVDNDDDSIQSQLITNNNIAVMLRLLLVSTKRPFLPRIEGYTENVIPNVISEDFRTHFRVSKDLFVTISEKIEQRLIFEHRGGNEQISPSKQLLLFLCYMANQATFRELGQYFGLGKSTAHCCISRVVDAFIAAFAGVIEWPNEQRQNEISQEIQLLHGLPHIIGAIDGTHIRLSSSPPNDSDYYNRKGFPSMQLQIVVDNNLKILDVYTGWPGLYWYG